MINIAKVYNIGTVLVETEYFVCVMGISRGLFNERFKDEAAWIIRNKLSGLVEAEGPDMAGAIRATYGYQRRLEETIRDPDKEEKRGIEIVDLESLLGRGEDDEDGSTGFN